MGQHNLHVLLQTKSNLGERWVTCFRAALPVLQLTEELAARRVGCCQGSLGEGLRVPLTVSLPANLEWTSHAPPKRHISSDMARKLPVGKLTLKNSVLIQFL